MLTWRVLAETVTNSSVIWRDMDPYEWLNKFYSRYMVIVVVIVNGRGLGIDACLSH